MQDFEDFPKVQEGFEGMIADRICVRCYLDVVGVVPPPALFKHSPCGQHISTWEFIARIPEVGWWWRFKRWIRGR